MFLLLFLFVLLFILVSIVYYSWYYGISPTPSSLRAQECIIDLIPSTQEGIIIELGSGWGNLAFALSKNFSRCTIQAYEISFIPWMISKAIQLCLDIKNLKILRKDFFLESVSDASVIVCYLYPGAMKRLKDKFEKELRSGTLVISHAFAVPEWTPFHIYYLNDMYKTPIYVYKYNKSNRLE